MYVNISQEQHQQQKHTHRCTGWKNTIKHVTAQSNAHYKINGKSATNTTYIKLVNCQSIKQINHHSSIKTTEFKLKVAICACVNVRHY